MKASNICKAKPQRIFKAFILDFQSCLSCNDCNENWKRFFLSHPKINIDVIGITITLAISNVISANAVLENIMAIKKIINSQQ